MPETEPSMYERMLAGQPYMVPSPEMGPKYRRAQQLMQQYNATQYDDYAGRREILTTLLGGLGDGAQIKPPFYCDFGIHTFLGEGVFVNFDCVFLDCNVIRIGNRTALGPKVQLYTVTHPLDPAKRAEGWQTALPITIGDDVWIGGGTIVCPGVTIGSGTTIGAGSVVTRSIPAGVFAAGNPCRIIREITPEA